MNPTYRRRHNTTAILVAPEFNEESTIQCLCQIRDNGLAVDLVGATAGVLRGVHGVAIRPDMTLSQLAESLAANLQLLIIPDGNQSVATLLSDPRVHRLIAGVFDRGGFVAAMSPVVRQILASVGVLTPARAGQFLSRGDGGTAEFMREVLGRVPA